MVNRVSDSLQSVWSTNARSTVSEQLWCILLSYLQHSWWRKKQCSWSPVGSHWRSQEYESGALIRQSERSCPPKKGNTGCDWWKKEKQHGYIHLRQERRTWLPQSSFLREENKLSPAMFSLWLKQLLRGWWQIQVKWAHNGATARWCRGRWWDITMNDAEVDGRALGIIGSSVALGCWV